MTVATHDNRGSWAGGRRDYTAAMKYAYGLLLEGKPYTFAANAAGVPTDALRTLWPDMGKRPEPTPPPPRKRLQLHGLPASSDEIIDDSAAQYGLHGNDLLSDRLDRAATHARQLAWFRLRREKKWTLDRIGNYFRRHHTTVRDGIRRHVERAEKAEK